MNKFTKLVAIAALVLSASACTRIDTGHIGVRTGFNGEVSQQELGVGFHQTLIGSVKEYVANEMTMEINDLKPQTKDRSSLSDLDLTFTYSIESSYIAEAVTKYKGRDLETRDHGIYPLGRYVANVVQTSATDVVSRYDALTANENREKIKNDIKGRVDEILAEEGLKGKIRVHQIFIKNLDIAPELKASATAVIAAQNQYRVKELEVQTAKKEAERMAELTKQNQTGYIELLRAQANYQIAVAVREGKVNTVIIPNDFKGIVNVK